MTLWTVTEPTCNGDHSHLHLFDYFAKKWTFFVCDVLYVCSGLLTGAVLVPFQLPVMLRTDVRMMYIFQPSLVSYTDSFSCLSRPFAGGPCSAVVGFVTVCRRRTQRYTWRRYTGADPGISESRANPGSPGDGYSRPSPVRSGGKVL